MCGRGGETVAYFRQRQDQDEYERTFRRPARSDDPYDEEPDDPDLPGEDEEDQAYETRERWRIAANIADFFGVIAGALVILVLAAVIITLVNWVLADMTQSFTLLQAWV